MLGAPYLLSYGTHDKFDRSSAVVQFFQAVSSPKRYPTYVFLKKEDVLFLWKIVPIICLVARFNGIGRNTKEKKLWKEAEAEFNSSLLIIYMAKKS